MKYLLNPTTDEEPAHVHSLQKVSEKTWLPTTKKLNNLPVDGHQQESDNKARSAFYQLTEQSMTHMTCLGMTFDVLQDKEGPSKDITDIAATALSLQPTGYTLETTQVCVLRCEVLQ